MTTRPKGNTMTDCTPAQARELAERLDDLDLTGGREGAHALRLLANQVEALTADRDSWANQVSDRIDDALKFAAERDVLSAVVASYERVGIVAHDGMNAKVGWTKPVRHNTMLFAVKDPK